MVITCTFNKIEFKLTSVKRVKEGHYIMINGSINRTNGKNYPYICTHNQSIRIHKESIERTEGRNSNTLVTLITVKKKYLKSSAYFRT